MITKEEAIKMVAKIKMEFFQKSFGENSETTRQLLLELKQKVALLPDRSVGGYLIPHLGILEDCRLKGAVTQLLDQAVEAVSLSLYKTTEITVNLICKYSGEDGIHLRDFIYFLNDRNIHGFWNIISGIKKLILDFAPDEFWNEFDRVRRAIRKGLFAAVEYSYNLNSKSVPEIRPNFVL